MASIIEGYGDMVVMEKYKENCEPGRSIAIIYMIWGLLNAVYLASD